MRGEGFAAEASLIRADANRQRRAPDAEGLPAEVASRRTGADKGSAHLAHATTYLIDLEHAVIVDVEATTAARQVASENRATRTSAKVENFARPPAVYIR